LSLHYFQAESVSTALWGFLLLFVLTPNSILFASAMHCVYADAYLVLLNKPAGLLSVPGRGEDKQDCLSLRVQSSPLFADALVVHRLDMATSGLMLMARGLDMQRKMAALFESRAISKQYTAIVQGCAGAAGSILQADKPSGWGLIDLPLGADWLERPRQKIDYLDGKPSQTRWSLQAFDLAANCSRVLLEPLTGRTHQLRVHLAACKHPILGDALYAPPAVIFMAPRLQLHASRLAFAHPATGEAMVFESQVPF